MKKCSTVDLREKEVVNLCDGTKLGCPTDFEFDVCDGKIISLVIADDGGIFGFSKKDDLIIPWCKIECFGEDTILVKLMPNDLECCRFHRDRKKKCK